MGNVPEPGGVEHVGRRAHMIEPATVWRELLRSDDLIELGMRAHAKRQSLHPGQIVTYSFTDPSQVPRGDGAAVRVVFDPQSPSFDALEESKDAEAIVPVCVPGTTATE